MPITQALQSSTVLVRMAGDPAPAVALVRHVVRDLDPGLALFGVEPLEETLRGTLAERRFTMLVLTAFAFAVAALTLALVGVAAGLVGALALAGIMRSLLFGVGAQDPFTFGGVALMLAAAATIASWLPARRAAKVDPMVALRAE